MSEELRCKRCGETENLETAPCFDGSPHYAKMSCGSCGAFVKFLPEPKNNGKRPPNKHTPESLSVTRCQLCGRPIDMLALYEVLEVHHVVEIQHGGEDTPGNIWVLCTDCHKTVHHRRTYLYEHQKGAMTVDKLRGLMAAHQVPAASRVALEELFAKVQHGRR